MKAPFDLVSTYEYKSRETNFYIYNHNIIIHNTP